MARRSRQPDFDKLKSADTTKDYMKRKYKVSKPQKAPSTYSKSTKSILKNMARPLSHESVVVFRTKNPKITDPSMGVRQYTRSGARLKQPPGLTNTTKLAKAQQARRNRLIMDAMNPDGPVNPTRRGTRLANKQLDRAYGRQPRGSAARARALRPMTRAGKALQAANMSGLSHPAASRAIARRAVGGVAGVGLLAAEALYKGYKRATGPSGKAFHGQFVDYTSKPTNRGKRGVNY